MLWGQNSISVFPVESKNDIKIKITHHKVIRDEMGDFGKEYHF